MLKWIMKIFKRSKNTDVIDIDQFNREMIDTNARLLAQYSDMINK